MKYYAVTSLFFISEIWPAFFRSRLGHYFCPQAFHNHPISRLGLSTFAPQCPSLRVVTHLLSMNDTAFALVTLNRWQIRQGGADIIFLDYYWFSRTHVIGRTQYTAIKLQYNWNCKCITTIYIYIYIRIHLMAESLRKGTSTVCFAVHFIYK